MAKLSSIEKNRNRTKMVKKFSGKLKRLLAIAKDKTTTVEERFAARQKLTKLPRNAHPTRLRNRCALTGRPRSVSRQFGLCRHEVRRLANEGQLPGVTKSSW